MTKKKKKQEVKKAGTAFDRFYPATVSISSGKSRTIFDPLAEPKEKKNEGKADAGKTELPPENTGKTE